MTPALRKKMKSAACGSGAERVLCLGIRLGVFTVQRLVSTEMQGIGWVVGPQSDPAAHTTGTAAQHNQHQQLPQQQQQQTYGGLRSNDERAQLHDQPLSTPTTALAANSVNAPVPVAVPAAPAGPARGGIVESAWGGVAKPVVSGRGVRSRKLEMDFDFEKEAALLAAKQRAAAQGEPTEPDAFM